MRPISHLVICYWTSDTSGFGRKEIDAQYRRTGYTSLPYHFVVRRDGKVEKGRPVERAGPIDHENKGSSINVCIVLPFDNSGTGELVKYTPAQRQSTESLIQEIIKEFPGIELETLRPVREVR
jgi:N-acetylmuramoyl-L-alanine amidase